VFEPTPALQAIVLGGHVLVSVAIFRYSRAIFLAVDYYLDPGSPAGGGDDPGGLGLPDRPFPEPGTSRRVPGRRRASRRGRETVGAP
jgi:hypothetical protein